MIITITCRSKQPGVERPRHVHWRIAGVALEPDQTELSPLGHRGPLHRRPAGGSHTRAGMRPHSHGGPSQPVSVRTALNVPLSVLIVGVTKMRRKKVLPKVLRQNSMSQLCARLLFVQGNRDSQSRPYTVQFSDIGVDDTEVHLCSVTLAWTTQRFICVQ